MAAAAARRSLAAVAPCAENMMQRVIILRSAHELALRVVWEAWRKLGWLRSERARLAIASGDGGRT